MIDIIDTLEKFDALKDEWERIEQNPDMRIFQTFLWCRNAWDICVSKEKGARLWILRWHQDGKDDVVIFPFYIDGKGCLRFIMDRHSDVCNAVYDSRRVNRHWVYKEASEAILGNKAIKSVWLHKMVGKSEVLNNLGVSLRAPIIYKDNAFSWVESEQCEDFVAGQDQLKSKDKADLKAINRKAAKWSLETLSSGKGDVFPLEAIVALKTFMLSATSRKDDFLSAELMDFIRNVYERGGSDILVLKDGDEIKALNFVLKKNGRLLSWIFLFSDIKTSATLYVKLMSELAPKGPFIFDFGVGVYDYKIGTFRPYTNVTFSLRFGKTAWEHIKCAVGINLRFTKDYIKMRIKKH